MTKRLTLAAAAIAIAVFSLLSASTSAQNRWNDRFHDVTLSPVTAVTVLSSANAGATLTLPAPPAGLFHYVTRISAVRTCTAAITGTALLGYTTTNLSAADTLAFTAGNACAVGSNNIDIDIDLTHPLKSSVAGTASTIVAPAAGAAGQVRITAFYYTAQ